MKTKKIVYLNQVANSAGDFTVNSIVQSRLDMFIARTHR